MISKRIHNIVQKEIQGGKVGAVFDSTKKRHAPSYRPLYWNDEDHIELNNCYNYGSTIRTDTFAQPGRASGTPLPPLFKAKDVKISAKADGFKTYKLALPSMRPPAGARHLVALVYYEGEEV